MCTCILWRYVDAGAAGLFWLVKCLFAFGNGVGVVYSLPQVAGNVCVATAHCSETGDEVARQAAIYIYIYI